MNTPTKAVATVEPGALIESVITKGDLSKLTPEERTQFYVKTCESMGLNPLTQPFSYITLNGKLVLYAKKDATDQLRSLHNISVTEMTETERDGVFVVTAKVQNGAGRTDMAKGAVTLGQAKGDMLANLIMKAETKAKRRATLSICGLGFLDETEIETIPGAAPANGKRTQAEISATAARKRQDLADCENDINQIETLAALERYEKEVLTPEFMAGLGMKSYALANTLERRRDELTRAAAAAEEAPDPETGELLPISKADFVRNCHSVIDEATDKPTLLSWWNSGQQKALRKKLLTPDERHAMQERVIARCAQLEIAA